MQHIRNAAGNVTAELLRALPPEDRVLAAWPHVCGRAVAARATAATYGNGTLVVEVAGIRANGLGYLNGGIISTVLDCHSAAAVLHEADVRGWGPLPGASLAYVTAGLDVRYLRPAPLTEPVTLHAVVTRAGESEMTVLQAPVLVRVSPMLVAKDSRLAARR